MSDKQPTNKDEVIELLEGALSYSRRCPGGKWELDLLKEAIKATLEYLDNEPVYRALLGL